MGKHAYLIMIHEVSPIFYKLIVALDYKDNDIYVHVDKKMSEKEFDYINNLKRKGEVLYSNIYFVKRRKVYWATINQTLAEIELFKKAVLKKYDYYHLISGSDFPIKSQAEIHKFFEENNGKEFVHFGTSNYQNDIQSRFNRYHFFVKQLGRDFRPGFWNIMETYSAAIQRRLNINRLKNQSFSFYGGANWCSVTHDFAQYIVDNFKTYYWKYRFTRSSDESYKQTILMNSHFKNNLYMKGFSDDYQSCVRKIDWTRGNPYVWRQEDYEELVDSQCMFARKFDVKIDDTIVKMIFNKVKADE